jgi:hypothetical protein
MKAQLVKRQDRFDLYNESDGSKIASTSPNPMGKLSLKNCEAIENGYDLDELADELTEHFNTFDAVKSDIQVGFKAGFQKALELLGNKKFSEDCLKSMCSISFNFYKRNDLSDSELEEEWENWFKDTLQSLQQTEWDVEIEMEWVQSSSILGNPHQIPKLDADGFLVLKRQDEK